MISTDALQVGFLSSLKTIDEGLTLTIIDKNYLKTMVLKNERFVFDFRRRFHNETIVFQKNENVNIQTCRQQL